MPSDDVGVHTAVRNLSVFYTRADRLGRAQVRTRALDGVSLDVPRNAIMGVAGSSGCGKSTLARCIAGWQRPSSGEVERSGAVQLVMQDPGASLNPRFTAFEIVEEPLRIRGMARHNSARVRSLLAMVGIEKEN